MNQQLFITMMAAVQNSVKTITSTSGVVEWSGGEHCNLPSLKFYGGCSKSGTPALDMPITIYDHTGIYQVNSEDRYIYLPNLRGINDYKDEWNYMTGKGLRYIHKVELDGVNDYKRAMSYNIATAGVAYCSVLSAHKFAKAGGGGFMSTHFKGSWNTAAVGCVWTFNVTQNAFAFTVDANKCPDLNSVNAWLAEQYANGTPVAVYYAMAEPIPFEERHKWDVYQPIPNDSGSITQIGGNVVGAPVEVTYFAYS